MTKYRCKKCKEDLVVLMSTRDHPVEPARSHLPCLMVCANPDCKMANLVVVETEAIRVGGRRKIEK